jgi:hypothetical protein
MSGEGRFDNTSTAKTPFGIGRIAQKHHKAFVCLCGTVGEPFKSYFKSCIITTLPEEITRVGLTMMISCHPDYKEELSGMTYLEEIAYYRQETPKILRTALGEFFSKNDIYDINKI